MDKAQEPKVTCKSGKDCVHGQENIVLQKELAVKSVISEIFQYQEITDDINDVYQKIYTLISEIIHIENFYIAILDNDLVTVPFLKDVYDENLDLYNEKTNPKVRKGLTKYALNNYRTMVLTETEIIDLEKKGEVVIINTRPKQWMFLPFHTGELKGGIIFQSYTHEEVFSYKDMSMLAYVTMHVGNFLSSYNAKHKIKQQYEELKATQGQLVHSEKMASIGQLAAGVAHEINNPLGYVNSNLNSLKEYLSDLKQFIDELTALIPTKSDHTSSDSETLEKQVSQLKEKHDIDFILTDTDELISESIFGMKKVKKIVLGLKNFSHAGEGKKKKVNINECIEDTVRIVWNEIKYHCEIKKNYAELPETYCHPNQLNQVFMNLLINAGHAIKQKGLITITTEFKDDHIYIQFRDNGSGIDEQHISQLFNPFFTTKPVGQGTGLGLSISYGIIENHNGTIEVESESGKGTCFKISLPIISELDETSGQDKVANVK